MRNLSLEPVPDDKSAISLVIRREGETKGASITKQSSSFRLTLTEGKGVYQSDASAPFNRRRAICLKGVIDLHRHHRGEVDLTKVII